LRMGERILPFRVCSLSAERLDMSLVRPDMWAVLLNADELADAGPRAG